MQTLTPVIFVEEIEPCLDFWVGRLGFQKTIEVPEGGRLGFAAVSVGDVSVMYQSRASLRNDVPRLAEGPFEKSGVLYIRTDNLDEIIGRLIGIEVVVPERETFYGAREIFVRSPCGTVVAFAQMTQ